MLVFVPSGVQEGHSAERKEMQKPEEFLEKIVDGGRAPNCVRRGNTWGRPFPFLPVTPNKSALLFSSVK